MAMKYPVARMSRRPGHRHRFSGLHLFCDLHALPFFREYVVLSSVTDAIHAEVRAVQVHGMDRNAGVDDAPVLRLTHRVAQWCGLRPGLAVDGKDLVEAVFKIEGDEPVVPEADHHHLFIFRRIWSVYDESARHGRVTAGIKAVDWNGREAGDPKEICPRRSRHEIEFFRLSTRHLGRVLRFAGSRMHAENEDIEYLRVLEVSVDPRA